jgi:hypothetical protein
MKIVVAHVTLFTVVQLSITSNNDVTYCPMWRVLLKDRQTFFQQWVGMDGQVLATTCFDCNNYGRADIQLKLWCFDTWGPTEDFTNVFRPVAHRDGRMIRQILFLRSDAWGRTEKLIKFLWSGLGTDTLLNFFGLLVHGDGRLSQKHLEVVCWRSGTHNNT